MVAAVLRFLVGALVGTLFGISMDFCLPPDRNTGEPESAALSNVPPRALIKSLIAGLRGETVSGQLACRRCATRRRAPAGKLSSRLTQMAKRRFAQASLSLTTSMFMLRRQRLADTSGTIPMPAPASTIRQTAFKEVTRALMFIVAPSRVA
jgi:hypothetical protein